MVMYPWVWQAILRETAPHDFTFTGGVNGYEIGVRYRGRYVGYVERNWMDVQEHVECDPWLNEMEMNEQGDRVPVRARTRASWRTCLFNIARKLPPDVCRSLKAVAKARGFPIVQAA